MCAVFSIELSLHCMGSFLAVCLREALQHSVNGGLQTVGWLICSMHREALLLHKQPPFIALGIKGFVRESAGGSRGRQGLILWGHKKPPVCAAPAKKKNCGDARQCPPSLLPEGAIITCASHVTTSCTTFH